ncbi:hypothetical protein ACMXYQ_08965 [Neptuniibacter sp. PT34_22]|uniref:hypothetical protein n=1 Tax=Neptuniibacter sp. PT34_22 TaxID=3398205 RepID=UPI0039F49FDC
MMKHFAIEPNVGVGPIKLGMSKAEVIDLFGQPEFENNERTVYLSGFMVDFDELNHVEFIEVAKSDLFEATYEGINLHNVSASQAVEHVCKFDSYDNSDPELGHSYIFKKLQLSLWRGTLPEDENDEDGKYFESVAIGVSNYFE